MFNESLLRLHCSFLLHAIRAGRFDVSIVCVSDHRIQHYNHNYRGIDKPTDVLSFPYHEVGAEHPNQMDIQILLYYRKAIHT